MKFTPPQLILQAKLSSDNLNDVAAGLINLDFFLTAAEYQEFLKF